MPKIPEDLRRAAAIKAIDCVFVEMLNRIAKITPDGMYQDVCERLIEMIRRDQMAHATYTNQTSIDQQLAHVGEMVLRHLPEDSLFRMRGAQTLEGVYVLISETIAERIAEAMREQSVNLHGLEGEMVTFKLDQHGCLVKPEGKSDDGE